MYEKFYHLNKKPFSATPDPSFLYLGEHHQEALSHLIYGVTERKGFIVLTGEVGSGKTTLIRSLLERLDNDVKTALIFNPNLTLKDLFLTILDEFGLRKGVQTKADFLATLNNFLIECLRKNETAVLIIDEAQNLSPLLLEEIRLLLNLETSREKLLQVILSGQPELNEKLNLPQLRQLRQRISIRYHLPPLTRAETRDYIRERLRVAGAKDSSIFSDKAIDEIYGCAKGTPRTINILCDNSLLTGYATSSPKISPEIVRENIEDLKVENAAGEKRGEISGRVSKNLLTRRVWWTALVLGFLSFVIAAGLLDITGYLGTLLEKNKALETVQTRQDLSQKIRKEIYPRREPPLFRAAKVTVSTFPAQKTPVKEKAVSGSSGEKTETLRVITVVENDTLSLIASRTYGWVNDAILAFIQRANPQIEDMDYIEVGQKINLPVRNKEVDVEKIER